MSTAEPCRSDKVTITTGDGFPLVAKLYPGDSRVLVISPAMAVGQRFYGAIARFFNQAGYTVVTYDYRGVGESLEPGRNLKDFVASVSDWALLDQRAVLRWVAQELAPERLVLLGHSLGGQVAGLNSDVAKIDAMVTVCSQSGYWKYQGGWEPLKVWFHVYVTFPVLCALYGYLPWSKMAKACDIPKAAALQLASWCRHPDYLFGDPTLPLERYADFKAPVLAFSIDDDHWGTARSVDALMSHYPKVERRHLLPAEFGLTQVGHFGFFKEQCEPVWRSVLEWLS